MDNSPLKDGTPQGICHARWLGRTGFQAAWDLQNRLAEERAEGRVPDTLLLLEHPETYTFGRRGNESNLLVPRQALEAQGVGLFTVDRGGDVTFHGPGQLVGYPVMDLRQGHGDVIRYMRDLEETLIRSLAAWGVRAGRIKGYTGVWVGHEKIAAIGVKVDARKITRHGFALNVTTDLAFFEQIIPCGIQDKGVTSLDRLLGRAPDLSEVAVEVIRSFGEVFGMKMQREIQNEG